MKAFIKLAALVAAICLTTVSLQAQTKSMSVKNDKLVVEENIQLKGDYTAINAVSDYLFMQGVLKDGYFCNDNTVAGSFYSPILYKCSNNLTTAKVYIRAQMTSSNVKLFISCDEIRVFFPVTELYYSYNPATNYPWKESLFDQKKTRIPQEAVRQTNQKLIEYIWSITGQLKEHINNFSGRTLAKW